MTSSWLTMMCVLDVVGNVPLVGYKLFVPVGTLEEKNVLLTVSLIYKK